MKYMRKQVGNKKQIGAFYIITIPARLDKEEFKIGFHKRSIKKLISRYLTPMPDLIIYYFHIMSNVNDFEKKIKEYFIKQRKININGHLTEWIKIEYDILYKFVRRESDADGIIIDKKKNIDLSNRYYYDENEKKYICLDNLTNINTSSSVSDSDIIYESSSDNEINIIETKKYTDINIDYSYSELSEDVPKKYSYIDLLNNSQITKIIITNRNSREGFIKINTWRQLHNIKKNEFDIENMECLQGYVLKYLDDDIESDEMNFLLTNICENTYDPTAKIHKPEYCEYFVYEKDKIKILSLCDFKTKRIPNDKVIIANCNCDISKDSDYNTEIIDMIISYHVNNNSFIKMFKQLCRNVLLEPNKKLFILKDIGGFGSYKLTSWLKEAVYKLGLGNEDYILSSEYYENRRHYNKIIKTKVPRCVFISESSKYSYKVMIDHFIKLGVKNIIIQYTQESNNYATSQDTKKYIIDNTNVILRKIPDSLNMCLDSLLENINLLFFNMLKWVLGK